ncbi:protein-disulfide reductase DsbD family protein [Fluviispira sanaruensis]|uniref:Protein-disulfide reductase DsbD n=1 Tax=Fluviispira sanaruensis TaxID=2493639 RepID=A0A4P2VUF1_FLUSA|nr:cytochrome c biogenesis protein CcdA [Fluviispira sanaruensis]BBH52482.1 protein-disulfide reductase DsbD [Fluviispira sanaruensis]
MTKNNFINITKNLIYLLSAFILLFSIQKSYASQSFSQFKTANENSNIKITDVVFFQIFRGENHDNKNIQISLKTANNFKIYEDKLKFLVVSKDNLPYEISYSTNKPSKAYKDPFYKKSKNVFESGTVFTLSNYRAFSHNDKIEIMLQSCSDSICLVPTQLILPVNGNNIAEELKNELYFKPMDNKSVIKTQEISGTDEKRALKNLSTENITYLNDNLALKIQQALSMGSFLLFPALFIAGLLMNLTPCVYPMIPITLNVLSQFGAQKEKKKKFHAITLPSIYVGGMVITYSLLGVFAGMTGNIFGAQLANPILNVFIAAIMFILGLSMLGLFNLSLLQNLAHKVPLADKYPRIAVGTMGAVSGLISAPCTGPVLSMILVLIAQNKNPLTGFTYMLFFALGFGVPYIFLGIFGQKFMKLPRFPKLINFTKIFFASLMFALSFYYLRSFLQNTTFIQNFYAEPNILIVIILLLLSIFFCLLFIKPNIIGKLAKFALIISCTILALWLTLLTTNSFIQIKSKKIESEVVQVSGINWLYDYTEAKKLAKQTSKPILFDVWADWCTACLEMKETTWKDKELIEIINKNFIAVQMDFTQTPDDIQILINRWGVAGLPAYGFFKNNSSFDESPDVLFQGLISTQKLINSAKNVLGNN